MEREVQMRKFWKCFCKKNFKEAQEKFDALDTDEKQAVLAEMYQKSELHRKPMMISVLRRELHDGNTFDDFYQSWFPSEEMTSKVEKDGRIYQQTFPTPVRVINGININNPKDIISVGITWVTNKEEEQGLWDHIKKASLGVDEANETRHDRIDDVTEGELIGLFKVESDDNLGSPF